MDEQSTSPKNAFAPAAPDAETPDSANSHASDGHDVVIVTLPPAPHSSHHYPHDDTHHTHGAIDPEIAASTQGLWAVKWSFIGLMLTAAVQIIVFVLSDSVALLADLIHNVADASTAIPLGLAFLVGRWKPTQRFSYGYGRAEDLAGVAVVAMITFSALVTGYESIERLFHPQPLTHLGALALAGLIGFLGNWAVSLFRIRVGKEIGSAALIADGHHARADSLISIAVVIGALGVWLGYSQADLIVGLLITAMLFRIVWETAQTMLVRILDGVNPEVIDEINHAVEHVIDVQALNSVRARWLGHRLYAEVAIAVAPDLSIAAGEDIAARVRAQLQEHIPYLAHAIVQVQPNEV